MMQSRGAAQYRAVSNHGLVSDASPARLVQIMYEEVLTQLTIAQGCMTRISNNLPLNEIVAKGKHDLLVPTGDGVREPQNRRVQIVYSGGATS